jgi:hypothetical protein
VLRYRKSKEIPPPIELAWNAIDMLEEDKEHWNQENFRCRTGHCYAGFVIAAAGGNWVSKNSHNVDVRLPNGKEGHVAEVASDLLGLPDWSFTATPHPFDQDNSLATLKRLVKEQVGPRPRRRRKAAGRAA